VNIRQGYDNRDFCEAQRSYADSFSMTASSMS
jgi:hypothetical protein